MSIELRYIIVVVVVAWLIAAGLIIVPRFIKRKPASANTTHGDIVNAIYVAMGIQMCLTITMMAFMFGIIITIIAK